MSPLDATVGYGPQEVYSLHEIGAAAEEVGTYLSKVRTAAERPDVPVELGSLAWTAQSAMHDLLTCVA